MVLSGSSPRVRGTLERETSISEQGRFIPAGAGNAGITEAQTTILTVHPRGCGERA